jgi:hypothetical protein
MRQSAKELAQLEVRAWVRHILGEGMTVNLDNHMTRLCQVVTSTYARPLPCFSELTVWLANFLTRFCSLAGPRQQHVPSLGPGGPRGEGGQDNSGTIGKEEEGCLEGLQHMVVAAACSGFLFHWGRGGRGEVLNRRGCHCYQDPMKEFGSRTGECVGLWDTIEQYFHVS